MPVTDILSRQLKNPAIRSQERSLYYPSPESLREQTRPNLKRRLAELVNEGEEVVVTDAALSVQFKYVLSFRKKSRVG